MNRYTYEALVIALLFYTGCAVRKPAFQTYRLVKQDSSEVLIPPGVTGPDVAQRVFWADITASRSHCPGAAEAVGLQIRKKRVRVTVRKDVLLRQAPGWLSNWTAELESAGCLTPGSGLQLANRIAESVPLSPGAAFRLLYSSPLHVSSPHIRLQMVSPILREGAAVYHSTLQPAQTSGEGTSLTVVSKTSADLIGYETAWYIVQPKINAVGFTIAPLYADRNVQGETERRPRPATDNLRFPPDAAFYRLFQKARETEFAQLVIAARTPAELEQRTKALETGTASCERLNDELCIPIARAIAVNLLLPINVNGAEVMVRWGTSVGEAIRGAGIRQPDSVLPELAVFKPYRGRLVAVDFDRAGSAILNLTLTGGENISWR